MNKSAEEIAWYADYKVRAAKRRRDWERHPLLLKIRAAERVEKGPANAY